MLATSYDQSYYDDELVVHRDEGILFMLPLTLTMFMFVYIIVCDCLSKNPNKNVNKEEAA